MANSVDHEQMPCSAASDLGQHCLLRLGCPNTKSYYGNSNKLVQTKDLIYSTVKIPTRMHINPGLEEHIFFVYPLFLHELICY